MAQAAADPLSRDRKGSGNDQPTGAGFWPVCAIFLSLGSACGRAPERHLGWRRSACGCATATFPGRQAAGTPKRWRRGGVPDATDADHRQLHDQRCGGHRSASYSATICGKRNSQSRSWVQGSGPLAHLSASAAEAWCLDNVAISASALPPGPARFGFASNCAPPSPKDEAAVIGDSGLNLTRLIEIFSRRPRDQQPQWTADAGPLRLGELKRHGRPHRANACEPAAQQADRHLFGGNACAPGRHSLDHHFVAGSQPELCLDWRARPTVSLSLQKTGHELYQRALRSAARTTCCRADCQPVRYVAAQTRRVAGAGAEPSPTAAMPSVFLISGRDGDRIDYLARRGDDVWQWSTESGRGGPGPAFARVSAVRAISWKSASRAICCAVDVYLRPAGGFHLDRVAGAAGVSGASHQPAHPTAHRGTFGAWQRAILTTRVEARARR